VDSLRRHGLEVRWRNLATWRRWFGAELANKLCRSEFHRYQPDLVFVFWRDLPLALATEFRRSARLVIWCEEPLHTVDASEVEYYRQADVVCMSNPARFAWLREHGLDNMAFLMSGFSPRFHRPVQARPPQRDVAFIGGPGRHGQRASLLVKLATEFDVHVYGGAWRRWSGSVGRLRVHGQIKNKAYAHVCATSRIVLGVNEVNDDEYYCSNRTFLTLACGAFHLTHYVPKMDRVFIDGEHLAYFRDDDDALTQVGAWLPRADERARVAVSGHAEVMAHHQYFYRVARILHWLKVGLPRADQPLNPTTAMSAPADNKRAGS